MNYGRSKRNNVLCIRYKDQCKQWTQRFKANHIMAQLVEINSKKKSDRRPIASISWEDKRASICDNGSQIKWQSSARGTQYQQDTMHRKINIGIGRSVSDDVDTFDLRKMRDSTNARPLSRDVWPRCIIEVIRMHIMKTDNFVWFGLDNVKTFPIDNHGLQVAGTNACNHICNSGHLQQ